MGSDGGNILNFSSYKKSVRDEKKRTAKKQKEETAAANRVRFGRTGAEKKREKIEAERRARLLDGKKLKDAPEEPGGDSPAKS